MTRGQICFVAVLCLTAGLGHGREAPGSSRSLAQSPPQPPMTAAQVGLLDPVPPTASLPKGERIELGRFVSEDVQVVQEDDGTWVVTAALSTNYTHRAPTVQGVAINASDLAGINVTHLDGYVPPHLWQDPAGKLLPAASGLGTNSSMPKLLYGGDEREVLSDTSYPWSAIGYVSPIGCTGTMISKRLVLTASHCLKVTSSGSFGAMQFIPARDGSRLPYGIANVVSVRYYVLIQGEGADKEEVAWDYAVMVLDKEMGALTGYLGSKTYSESWNGDNYWTHVGYPARWNGAPAVLKGQAVERVTKWPRGDLVAYEMGHYMDTEGGHSGGPLFGYWDGKPYVVGVHSGGSETPNERTGDAGDNNAAGGFPLGALITRSRNEFD